MNTKHLLDLCVLNFKSSFTTIHATEWRKVRAFIRRQADQGRLLGADVDDATQEVWLRLWTAFLNGKFADLVLTSSKVELFEESRRWLFGTALNVVREFSRRGSRGGKTDVHSEEQCRQPSQTHAYADVESQDVIECCPVRDQKLARLLIEGWNATEIAQKEGLSRRTVYRRLNTLKEMRSVSSDKDLEASEPL